MATVFGSSFPPDQIIGGYPVEVFLNLNATQKERLTCGCCKQIVRNPIYVSKCNNGHRYCQSCFTVTLVQNQDLANFVNCEKCRKAIQQLQRLPTNYYLPTPQINQIYRSDVGMKKSLATLQIKCPNTLCSFNGPLSNYEQHILVCEHQEIECPYNCKTKIKRIKLEEHKIKCEKNTVKCDFCLQVILRDQWPAHQNTCNHAPECCTLCNQRVKRLLMTKHLAEECVSRHKCPFNCPKVKERSLDEHNRKNFERHKQELHTRFKILEDKDLESLLNFVHHLSFEQTAEKLKRVRAVIDPPEPGAGGPISQPQQVCNYVCWDRKCIARIHNVSCLRNTRDPLESEAFYLNILRHPVPADLLLRVLVSATGEPGADVAGRFLTLFACICRGQDDELLKWPFQGRLSLTLLDQSSRRRHVQKYTTHLDQEAFKKPSSERNAPVGFGNYIEFDTLLRHPIFGRDEQNSSPSNSNVRMEQSLQPKPEYIRMDQVLIKCEVDPLQT